jgi:hypothetical protein
LFTKEKEERRNAMFEEGHRIRIALAEIAKTQVWLINQLAKRGIITDKTEMSSVLSGTRHGSKADLMLQTSVEILNEYRDGHRKENEQF